ncbi:MAG TPA: hypothetical protein VGK34_00035, partial [Armatimonadota bacterium]
MTTNIDRFANIPSELIQREQWVVWRLIDKGEKKADGSPKFSKVPFDAKSGDPASSTGPETWCSYATAVAAVHEYSGIGFVFHKDDPYVGIDLDNAINGESGLIDGWAKEIVDHFHSYAEHSVSGTGVHIIVRDCHKPGNKCKRKGYGGRPGQDVEIYERGLYFCFTGELLTDKPSSIESCQADMNWLYHKLFGSDVKPAAQRQATVALDASDADLIDIASRSKQGEKFKALWNGDASAYGGDHSSADLGLMSILAFYTGRDAARMDRLFRQSGLMREKYENREDYRNWTIDKAIQGCAEVYTPKTRTDGPDRSVSKPQDGLYRLSAVQEGIESGETVYLTGSKGDADALVKLGLCGTSAPLIRNTEAIIKGYAQSLHGAKVIILPVASKNAQNHALQVAQALQGIADEVRIIHLPELDNGAGVRDWMSSGGTREKLEHLTQGATIYQTDVRCLYTGKRRDSTEIDFRRTELGNAERFIYEHGEGLKYNVDAGYWLCWDGKKWNPDHKGAVHRRICDTVRGMYDILKHAGDQASKWYAHIQDTEKAKGLSAIEKLARFREGIPVQSDDMDADAWLLNCANGTVDLRTGNLRPHRQSDLITKISNVEYDQNARCKA